VNKKIKAHIAVITVALIYGSNYIIAKDAMASGLITPNGFIASRVIFGAFVFYLIHRFLVKEKIDQIDISYAALCGLFGIAINQLCFFQGLNLTSPMHASLIMITTPIIVLVLSAIILKNKIYWRQTLGIGLGLIGAYLLIKSAGSNEKISSLKGDLFILANATSYALYLVLVKRLLVKYHPYTVMRYVFFFGMLFVLPFGLEDLLNIPIAELTTNIWIAIAFVLIFTTVLAYLLNGYALSIIEPSTVSFYIYFQPLIASLISISMGQDNLDFVKVQSSILLFFGVYLVLTKNGIKGSKTFTKR